MADSEPFWGSPAQAYRADMAGRAEAFGRDDDAWLRIASILHSAARADGAKQQLLDQAIADATELLGASAITEFVKRDWSGIRGSLEAIMALVERMERSGALRLAAIVLDDLASAAVGVEPRQRGHVAGFRARVDRGLGRFDEAVERYGQVAAMGRREGLIDLQIRAEIGLTAVAQMRGNFPDLRLHAERAAALARRHGYASLLRLASQGITVAATKAGEYETALTAGWTVMQLSDGDPILESEALQNLGQLMLEAGHPAGARACFAAVMTRGAPSHTLLPALGGLALASAQEGNEATVEWSVREVWRARTLAVPRFELAEALLESSVALASLGRGTESERYRQAAEEIAKAEGYHELVFRSAEAQRPVRRSTPAPIRASGTDVIREVSRLEPAQLPAHVEFQAAPV